MPLEIKELHIRVTVDSQTAQGGAQTGQSLGGGSGVSAQTADPDPAFIEACTEKILEILIRKTER